MEGENSTYCSPQKEIEDYETVENIFTAIYAFLPIFAVIALIANLNFLLAVYYGVQRGKLPSKRYIMPACRSIADILTILVSLIYFVHEQIYRCNAHFCVPPENGLFSKFMQSIFILNYWSVALCYTGIALLTYYAVMAPIQYKTTLTGRSVRQIAVFGLFGMVAILLFCIFVIHGGDLNYNANSVIHLFLDDYTTDDNMGIWLVDLCVQIENHPPYRSALVTMIPPTIFYMISIAAYFLISKELFINRSSNMYHRHRSAMWRLGLHLLLFSLTCFLTAAAYYGSIPMSSFCKLQRTTTNVCMSPVVSYTFFTAAAVLGWSARMGVDGLIDTYVDGILRRAFLKNIIRAKPSMHTCTTADARHMHDARSSPRFVRSISNIPKASRASEVMKMDTMVRSVDSNLN